MHPSPGERFHLETLERQRAAAAAADTAAQAVARAAATSAATRNIGLGLGVGTMEYEELRHEFVELAVTSATTSMLPLPGRFGTALSLVATVSADAVVGASHFWWWLATGFGDNYWDALAPPGGSAFRAIRGRGTVGIRLHGPFADRLAVGYGFKNSARLEDSLVEGRASTVKLVLGVQRA